MEKRNSRGGQGGFRVFLWIPWLIRGGVEGPRIVPSITCPEIPGRTERIGLTKSHVFPRSLLPTPLSAPAGRCPRPNSHFRSSGSRSRELGMDVEPQLLGVGGG